MTEETTVSEPMTNDDLNRPISGMGMLDLVDEVKNLRAKVRRLQGRESTNWADAAVLPAELPRCPECSVLAGHGDGFGMLCKRHGIATDNARRDAL